LNEHRSQQSHGSQTPNRRHADGQPSTPCLWSPGDAPAGPGRVALGTLQQSLLFNNHRSAVALFPPGHTSTTLRPDRQRKGEGAGIPSPSPHGSDGDHHDVDDDDTAAYAPRPRSPLIPMVGIQSQAVLPSARIPASLLPLLSKLRQTHGDKKVRQDLYPDLWFNHALGPSGQLP
jgi:hypothetical protein